MHSSLVRLAPFLLILALALPSTRAAGDDLSPEQRQKLEQESKALNERGGKLYSEGRLDEAVEALRQAVEMRKKLYPQGHGLVANSMNNLAFVLKQRGDLLEAEPYVRQALEIWQKVFSPDKYPEGHPLLARCLNDLGYLLEARGERAKAETYHRQALAMNQRLYPPEKFPQGHPILAISLNNLGAVLQARGELAKAEPFYREALAMRRKLYPADKYPQGHPELGSSLNNLGTLLQDRGELTEAETLFRQSLEMDEKLYPRGHPSLAFSLNNMGSLFKNRGEFGRAEPYLRKALDIRQKLYPPDRYPHGHIQVAAALNNLGYVLMCEGEYGKATLLYRQALEIYQNQILQLADTVAEAEALNFAASLPATRDGYLSVTRHLPPDAAVYEHVWQSRSALTRVLERRHLDLAAARSPEANKLAKELAATRRRLAQMLLAAPAESRNHAETLQALTEEKEKLERQLAGKLRLERSSSSPKLSPQRLSEVLPERTAFIDLLCYLELEENGKPLAGKKSRGTFRYVAFVMVANQPAVRVELAKAETIDQSWAAWHQAIMSGKPDRDAAAAVARLVWKPLAAHLPAGTRTVWIAPDRLLSQLPWGALPGSKEDAVLLDDMAIAIVPHGPFLLERLKRKAAPATSGGRLLAVGGVAFDRAPAGNEPGTDTENRSTPVPGKRVLWKELPGTLKEQEQIADLASKVLKQDPIRLTGTKASVGALLEELPRAKFAHLATHGFFAAPSLRSAFQADERQFQMQDQERSVAGARSPLVLSGLVLAGANRQGADADDRGILTAESIVGLRLEELELATLSACETGLGELAGGEGVLGLTRAFHLAGTRNVVASLWKVDDDATSALMILFYRNLWIKKNEPLEAMRQAQLNLYRHPEQVPTLARARGLDLAETELPKVSSPTTEKMPRAPTRQWAAFVLSGLGN